MLVAALLALGSVPTASAAPTDEIACVNGQFAVGATIGDADLAIGGNTGLQCLVPPL